MFSWSQLDFFVSCFNPCSLFNKQTNLAKYKQKEKIAKNSKYTGREKDIRKKRHLAAFAFVPSVFGEKFPTGEF
jgi:hypothetical protein